MFALQKRFKLQKGITGIIKGSIPVGGLSSSAAVLIAYVMAFAKANSMQLEAFEVMKIASEAERERWRVESTSLWPWLRLVRYWYA